MIRAFVAACAAVLATATPAESAAKRPMTVEDLWAMTRVGAPSLSPDGKWAVFSATDWSMEENKSNSDLWIVPTDASAPPRRLTFHEGSDGGPSFSPDGRFILFSSKRGDGPSQLYRLPVDGGEAEKLTDLPVPPEDPKWFPDGTKIVFLAHTWPDLNDDFAAVKKRLDEAEKAKAKAFVSENRLVRYWDRWVTDGRYPHFFALDLATRKVTDLTPGMARHMGLMETGGGWDLSPSGGEIAFTANATEPPYATLNYDVFVVGASGGQIVNLTADNPADDGRPRYSPDGRWLLYGRQTRANVDPDFTKLTLRNRDSGTTTNLAAGWDFNPSGWEFAPDSTTITLVAEQGGRDHLWALTLDGTPPRLVRRGGSIGGARPGPDGLVVYSKQSILSPAELFATTLAGEAERALTAFNRERLEALDLGSYEDVRFRGAGGDEVQMFVVYPPGFDPKKKWPLLQVLHGGPHGSTTDSWHYRWNAALFSSNGIIGAHVNFHGSMGEGQKFAESIVGAHGDKPYEDVMKSTDALIARGFVDPERMAVSGGSYGGYLTSWTISQTPRFKAAIVHAGVYDFLSQMASDVSYGRLENYGGTPWDSPEKIDRWSPSRQAKGFRTPTLVIHGDKDYRVPVTQGLELYGVLQAKGVPSRLVVFPEENHWVLKPQNAKLWWSEFFGWLDRYGVTGGGK
ncbi:MAG TPA: S9 family peptidase [Candidatus Polarisedimenticolaceae bacterium]